MNLRRIITTVQGQFIRVKRILSAWAQQLWVTPVWARIIAIALFLFLVVVVVIDHYVAPHSIVERTALIQVLAQVAGAIGLVVTLTLTARQLAATTQSLEVSRAQLDVAREGQLTDRFAKAIAQLGDEKMEIGLGGIYALERIARDSERDYNPIIDVLTAYLRNRARKPATGDIPAEPPSDIQAALTVVARRSHAYNDGETRRLNLAGVFIPGADLPHAQFDGAIFVDATLDNANLGGAHLRDADLHGAHLESVNLGSADLRDANLAGVVLTGEADLAHANLTGANLTNAQMKRVILYKSRLEGATLNNADLTQAHAREVILDGAQALRVNMHEASLEDASLIGANLSHANLSSIRAAKADFSGTMLGEVIMDHATLTGARLTAVFLAASNLRGTDLRDAQIDKANLANVDLSYAELTQEQLDRAIVYRRTMLPAGLSHPAHAIQD